MKMKTINSSKQKGVVLLIAMIILIAMSLAGVALNRSVNTALGVAGNLAFKQSAVNGADLGVAKAVDWINSNRADATLDTTATVNGYYSNAIDSDWTQSSSWVNAKQVGVDEAGNTIEYLIHRLCAYNNTPYNGVNGSGQQNQCSLIEAAIGGVAGNSISAGAFQFTGTPQVVYRITARSTGPKASKSIIQTFYSVPM